MQHGISKKYCRNILLCSVGRMIGPACLHQVDWCGIGIKYWTGMFKSGGAWGILSCGIGIKYWVVSSVGYMPSLACFSWGRLICILLADPSTRM